MTVTWQTLITFGAVIGALAMILKYYNKGYDLIKHQEAQDKEIKAIKAEQQIITYGVLCCLKGLHEQGANGPVTEAISTIEKYLNKQAHEVNDG